MDSKAAEDAPGKLARFYPIKGGVIKTMKTEGTGYTYLSVDGVQNCIAALKEIEAGSLRHCFIEMNACEAVSYTHLDVYKRQGLYRR